MVDLTHHMHEDRTLRDAALSVLKQDYEHVQTDLYRRGIGSRIADRISEGASDIFEDAVGVVDANRGVFTSAMAAATLWLARHPILSFFVDSDELQSDGDAGPATENGIRQEWAQTHENDGSK